MEVYQRMPLLRDASPGKGGLCGGVPEDAMHLLRDASPGTVKVQRRQVSRCTRGCQTHNSILGDAIMLLM